MIVLGIETTCDETAAAVVERFEDGREKSIQCRPIVSGQHAAFVAWCEWSHALT